VNGKFHGTKARLCHKRNTAGCLQQLLSTVRINSNARLNDKSSAVAEMGDRLATIGPKSGGGLLCPFLRGGAESPSDTRAEAFLHTKWHLDPFNRLATIHQRYIQTDRTEQDRIRQDIKRPDSIG